jgi:hypothetical protein
MPWSVAGSRLALILRRARGRFGIAAAQVSVRTRIPWYWRIAGVLGIAVLAALLAVFSFDAGRQMAGFDQSEAGRQVGELKTANVLLEEEVGRLRSLLAARESSLEIEKASQRVLSEKNSLLTAENAKLKEDLAVIERLAKLETNSDDGILLDQFNVKPETAGQYRYSFLIALQGMRRGKETKLNMQLLVSRRGSSDKIVLPQKDDLGLEQYEIVLRNFRRIDGRLAVPNGFVVGEVEVRILEAGVQKASRKLAL